MPFILTLNIKELLYYLDDTDISELLIANEKRTSFEERDE